MEQIAVSFTDGGVPKTGLTPKITILGRDGTVFVNNDTCKELSNGWYIYNFAKYNPTKVYLYVFDGGNALSNDYDRYKFGGNEFDAYSNKYSWGRTAAPYFTSINGRFDNIDKAFKDAEKNKYQDTEVVKGLNDIRKEIKASSVNTRLNRLEKILDDVKKSVVDTSATNDGNSSKNFSGINGKLDLMAEYVVKIKEDIDNQLSTLDEDVATKIQESNDNINQGMSDKVNVSQLLQQVSRLEGKLEEVLSAFVSTTLNKKLPNDIVDRYNITLNRKGMSEEDMARALGIDLGQGMGEGIGEGIGEGMEEGMGAGLGEPRPEQMNAPVDMQGIAEPEMPAQI